MELPKSKIKPTFKLANDFFDVKEINNVLIEQIEENIKIREMSIEKQLRRQIKNKPLTRD